jgi:hypothetical protein
MFVDHLFASKELKRGALLGVFGVADHESDIHLIPRLGVRTPLAALGSLVL